MQYVKKHKANGQLTTRLQRHVPSKSRCPTTITEEKEVEPNHGAATTASGIFPNSFMYNKSSHRIYESKKEN